MAIMETIRGWIAGRPMHGPPQDDVSNIQPPMEVRQVSHDISNTASRVQARAHLVQKEAEFLLSFVRQVQGDKNVRFHQ